MRRTLSALVICMACAVAAAAQQPVPPPKPAELNDPHAGHQMGMAKSEELLQIVRSVADDKGESSDSGGGSK